MRWATTSSARSPCIIAVVRSAASKPSPRAWRLTARRPSASTCDASRESRSRSCSRASTMDAASARLLAGLGFPALATSSGAKAGVLGKRDGKVTREEALANAKMIVEATDLPVAADLEKGFGDGPDATAETIRQAAGVGLVGGSIEDATGNKDKPLFDIEVATQRIAAAVKAARALSFPFTLTARAEGFLRGQPDLDDVIRRLQAFEAAGADVLMAPGLPDLAAVKKVCGSLNKPFNFMVGIKGRSFTKADLA